MGSSTKIDINSLTYRQSTTAIILDQDNNFLIVQKHAFKDNEWDFPGGGIEKGELPEMAIIRELTEELGCNKFEVIKKSQFTDQYDWPPEVVEQRLIEKGTTFKGQQRIQFFVKFFGDKSEIKIQEEELRHHKWVPLHEIDQHFVFPRQLEKFKITITELP